MSAVEKSLNEIFNIEDLSERWPLFKVLPHPNKNKLIVETEPRCSTNISATTVDIYQLDDLHKRIQTANELNEKYEFLNITYIGVWTSNNSALNYSVTSRGGFDIFNVDENLLEELNEQASYESKGMFVCTSCSKAKSKDNLARVEFEGRYCDDCEG